MKSSLVSSLLILGSVLLGLCNAAPLSNDEDEARKFAAEFSVKVNTYLDGLANLTFSSGEDGFASKLLEIVSRVETSAAIVEIVSEAKKFDYKNFKDEELKRVFAEIRMYAEDAIDVGPDKYLRMLIALDSLGLLAADTDISSFEDPSVELAYFPDVQNIIAKSNNPDELLHYWIQWRERNSKGATLQNFVWLVEGLKDAANLTEMSAYEYWMREYDIKQMDNVMEQIKPFYSQMHAFIRNKLNKKYGDSVIKPDGLIPDHLFQQVLAQSWTNGSIIDDLYPHENLPPYDSILEQNQYDALKIFKMADKFYQSLGFESIPENFWDSRIRMKKSEDEGDCKATIYDLTSNVYMEYCQKMDFRKFLQAHGYIGELYYAREMAGLPAYYFHSHDLKYPVGEAVILSASTPKHLNAVGIVTDFEFTDEVLMNRLIRMSLHTMINIPLYYVHTKVMFDLFSGTVEMTELNKHYWELMDKYVGVGPPADRISDGFDFPYTFYIELNENRQARKFDSEVLGYQFYKKMCSISGQYPKESLQNCDFYGSKEVGDALKKMMKLGGSKPFEKVLGTFLPEDAKVNAESLLEYYHPVKTWLNEKNHESNAKLGWTHSDKRVESVKLPVDSEDQV